jgi:hypothetical protein
VVGGPSKNYSLLERMWRFHTQRGDRAQLVQQTERLSVSGVKNMASILGERACPEVAVTMPSAVGAASGGDWLKDARSVHFFSGDSERHRLSILNGIGVIRSTEMCALGLLDTPRVLPAGSIHEF